MVQLSPVALACVLSAADANALQFPQIPTYETILTSPINPNITISYKQPNASICATAFDTQKQYTGYVNLPPYTLAPFQQNYSINTFFWFIESRISSEIAPLTIWLSGGPGSSSMVGLFEEVGPCEVVQLPNGSYNTQPRLWGWDRSSNLLFIDQPTQTGFSYDERVNASIDLGKDYPFVLENRMEPQPLSPDTPKWRFMNGTFASGRRSNTQDTTAIAARACWHFLQGFLSAFPQYNPGTRPNRTTVKPAGVNLFTESYGGMYGPTFADFFEDQNDRRNNGSLPNSTLEIQLDSVGIINGAVDLLTELVSIANFTRNNTYGMTAIDLLTYQNAMSAFNSDTGCRGSVTRCRDRMQFFDPEGFGLDKDTNELCAAALNKCESAAAVLYRQADRNPYDIRIKPKSGLSAAYQEYLNTAHVMQSIGAQVNYTQSSVTVLQAFSEIGDSIRGTQLNSLAKLLDRGIRVALIYGDADIICNWYGGQNASLELARLIPGYNTTFSTAGYADIVVNDSYVGGHVRQYGNLSFSRIFDAGHLVPLYQPETAFTVFSRIIQGHDISMGQAVDVSTYGTKGISNSLSHVNKIPAEPPSTCWIRDVTNTCTLEERNAIEQGQGIVSNGVWAPAPVAIPKIPAQSLSQSPSVVPKTTTTVQLTGVFTATATPTAPPKSTSGASRKSPFGLQRRANIVFLPWDEKISRNARKSRQVQRGLIGGLAAAGGLLFVILWTLLFVRCCRRHRKDVRPSDKDPEQNSIIVPQVQEEIFVPSRHPSTMEPILEQSPRPSDDTTQMTLLSALPNSSIIMEDTPLLERPDPIPVNRPVSAGSTLPTGVPTVVTHEGYPVVVPVQHSMSPEESQVAALATPPASEPTPSPSPPPGSTASPETRSSEAIVPPLIMQRSVSLPLEPTGSVPSPPAEVEVAPKYEAAPRKSSLIERFLHPLSERLGDVEEPMEGREPTPPPRAATLPRPSRAQTVAVPPVAAEV